MKYAPDTHAAIAQLATTGIEGLTAFSALPNAPVLPVKQRRRSPAQLIGFARSGPDQRHRQGHVYKPTPA